jgi:hypothetical protein
VPSQHPTTPSGSVWGWTPNGKTPQQAMTIAGAIVVDACRAMA